MNDLSIRTVADALVIRERLDDLRKRHDSVVLSYRKELEPSAFEWTCEVDGSAFAGRDPAEALGEALEATEI